MATLPWLQNQQSQNNGGSDLLSFLMQSQPSAGQSIASALPFYNLPKKQAQYFQPAYDATSAMGDMDNPLYKKIYGQKREAGQQNLSESIAELSRQNRKLQMLGRAPLLDNERGSENIFRNLIQGYQDVQNRAATDTQSTLGEMAKSRYMMAQQQAQLAQNKAGVKGNLLGALTKLFGL